MSISIRVPTPHPADNIHILGIRIHIPGMFIHIPGICIHFPPEALFTSLRNLYTHPPEYALGLVATLAELGTTVPLQSRQWAQSATVVSKTGSGASVRAWPPLMGISNDFSRSCRPQ